VPPVAHASLSSDTSSRGARFIEEQVSLKRISAMSNWEYVFDLGMLLLFWTGVFSIIVAIILRIKQNQRQHRSESGGVSATKTREAKN
jgi:hypothetical protein